MAPIVAARRHRVVAHPPVAGRHVRTVAWIAFAIGMSVVLVALVAVLAIAASIGVLSADLPDPTRLGSLASAITDLPLELG
jgi:hypothetical protein